MAALQVKALAAGLVVVAVAVAAATFYHAQHPNEPVVAKLTGELKDALQPKPDQPKSDQPKPDTSKPATPSPEAAKPEAPKPPQQQANLGNAPTAQKPVEAPVALGAPTFDTVRVEPSGDIVAAGRGAPKAKVALLASGKPLGEADANDAGEFVIIPSPLAPGSYDLTLRQTMGGASKDSTQTVAVSVPVKRGDQVVVALAEPGKPTKLMSAPPQAPAPGVATAPPPATPPQAAAPAPQAAPDKPQVAVAPPPAVKPSEPGLAIRSVELENGTGFYATGVAAPGTQLQIYLNGAHIAEVVAGPDGAWSVTIRKGLTGGHYAVRVDAIGGDKKVSARAEVPFDVPVGMAAAPAQPKPAEAKPDEAKPAEPKPAEVAAAPEAGPAPPSAPTPDEAAASPSVAAPGTPDTKTTEVPAPRPDIAAAAKAAGEKAPGKAPPVLAAAPPAAPGETAVPPPAQTNISPSRPASTPPTIAAAPPTVAPPKQAVAPPGPPAPAAAPSGAPGANAVIEQVETASVVRGDSLWNISRTRLGEGTRYTQIYAANATQIRNPDLIYPGQVFVMPKK